MILQEHADLKLEEELMEGLLRTKFTIPLGNFAVPV